MPILSSSAVLSASFETGDIPTSQDFKNLISSFAIYDGTLPVISGSITSTGSFSQLEVTNVGTNLIPYLNDTIDIGSPSLHWNNVYFSTASLSMLSSSLIPHNSGTYLLGSDSKGFKETHTDTASIGIISSSLTPDADNTYDLGASGQEWKDLYVDGIAYIDRISNTSATTIDTASIGVVSSSLIPDGNNLYDLGSASLGWKDLYVSGTATIGTLSISALDEGVSITSISSSTQNITVSGSIVPFVSGGTSTYDLGTSTSNWNDLYLSGSVIADSASIGVASFNAISSSLIPDTNTTYDLGSSTLNWGTIYATTFSGSIVITGSSTLSAETASISYLSSSSPIIVGASIIPDITGSHDLGSSAFNFRDIHASRTATVGTGSMNKLRVTGNVTSNLIPDINDLYNLGSPSKEWKNLHINGTANIDTANIDTGSIARLNSDLIPNFNNIYNLGSLTDQFANLFVSGTSTINSVIASGTVSASGNITALNFIVTGSEGNITASGDISASGTVFASNLSIGSSGGLSINGDISASGNITASGIVGSDTGSFELLTTTTASIGYLKGNSVITIDDDIHVVGNITASGNISASQLDSNIIYTNQIFGIDDSNTHIQIGSGGSGTEDMIKFTAGAVRILTLEQRGAASGRDIVTLGGEGATGGTDFEISSSGAPLQVAGDGNLKHLSFRIDGVTGNVTASGDVSSSGIITTKDLIIDYNELPVGDPSVKGQVYRNGSNQLFVSVG